MSQNEIEDKSVPLRNLFSYIRDLYNTAEPIYNFEKEPNTPKAKDSTYWQIGELLKLYQETGKKNISELQMQLLDDSEPIIKLKRVDVEELIIPDFLNEWIIINQNNNEPPRLSKKEMLERRNVPFENSSKRIDEYNKLNDMVENSADISEGSRFNIPELLKGWVKLEEDNGKHIIKKQLYGTEIECFDDDKNRAKAFDEFKKKFDHYYNRYYVPLRINKLYDALHSLYYDLKGKESKKLYISFGLVSGKIGGEVYRNFLFNIPLRISLKKQEITIELDVFVNRIFCEQFFTELFEHHFKSNGASIIDAKKKEVIENVDEFNARMLEFTFDSNHIREVYYESALKMLTVFPTNKIKFFNEEELDYEFCNDIDDRAIIFSFSPIIQTKTVESQILVSKDASNIIKKLTELESENRLESVPDFFKKLFSAGTEKSYSDTRIDIEKINNSRQVKTACSPNQYPRFLFPLAYNDEQLEIVKRLYEQDAVTVKGPPGTGKSHTIANVISHFVAQGKSILVVSQNAKALSVIMEKLPHEIQKLAISLVNESKDNKALKNAVESILSRLNNRYDENEVNKKEEELRHLDIKYRTILEKVYNLIQLNNKEMKIYNPHKSLEEEKTASEWAEYIFHNSFTNSFIEEKVSYESNVTWLPEKIMEFIQEANGFKSDDFNLANYEFYSDDSFIRVHELRKIKDLINDIVEVIDPSLYESVDYRIVDDKFSAQFKSFLELYKKLKNSIIIEPILIHQEFDFVLLENLLDNHKTIRTDMETLTQKLLEYSVELNSMDNVDADILSQNINKLILKFNEKETMNILQKSLLPTELKKLFNCKVNFIPLETLTQLKVLELFVKLQTCNKKLNIIMGNYLSKFDIKVEMKEAKVYDELTIIVNFYKSLEELNCLLTEKGIPRLIYSDKNFEKNLKYIDNLNYYIEFKKLRDEIDHGIGIINSQMKPHPSLNKIKNYIDTLDIINYDMELERYRELRLKSTQSQKVNSIYNDIFQLLPTTAQKLKSEIVDKGIASLEKRQIEEELFLLIVEDFLRSVTAETNAIGNALDELQTVKRNVESKTAELIAYKTWYNKSKKVNDFEKSALTAWLNDLINIGRGYGKNTARNTQSAIQNMQIAKGAVPIWIMTTETAISFLPDVSLGQFDLLIIDEASQCDISCLNLIFRCKKCIVVGDENQTSVATNSSVFPIERTNVMLDRYLYSHPFKQQFNVNNKNNSIYTLSGVIYPNIISLFEHFRCLPEIIGFSNKYVYNNDIIPLKTATEYKYGNPIEMYYVEDEIEDDEKPNIIKKSIEIIESYVNSYIKGEIGQIPTIGIITLDSSNTRHQQGLIRKIANSELIKMHEDKLELLIGTSREFQGDEKDIIILTTTTSHSINDKFELKPPKAIMSEEYSRIYNVASSRAKEKSILLHSIRSEAVAMMNPDCYRKRLIDYYTESQTGIVKFESRRLDELLKLVDANSGGFERTVCTSLYNQGFADNIHPQFKVGKYKIDFAIIKNNKKLAIECDGVKYHSGFEKIREDISRQIVLERAGWKFFRIQSTEWFYKNEYISRKLFNWLNESIQN